MNVDDVTILIVFYQIVDYIDGVGCSSQRKCFVFVIEFGNARVYRVIGPFEITDNT